MTMIMKNVHLENPPHLLQNPIENQPLNFSLSAWNRSTQRAVLQNSCSTMGILLGKLIQFYVLLAK